VAGAASRYAAEVALVLGQVYIAHGRPKVHKYSDAAVDLLKKVHGAEEYDI
jgi:hypothetical protein